MTLTAISSMATRHVMDELADLHARRSGSRTTLVSVGGVEASRRVGAGEAFDVVVLASSAMARLVADGLLLTGSCVAVAQSGMAVAVRQGAPKPAFDTEADIRQAVLSAARVGYSTGPSGDHLKRLLERWEMTEAVRERLVQAAAGVPVARLLAEGTVDLGFQQLSELVNAPGVATPEPLPPAIQETTVFTAGIATACSNVALARTFIRFLASEEFAATKRRHGMEPAEGVRP